MKTKHSLLDKYYKGETSIEEENELKNEVLTGENNSVEKDIFGYYNYESTIPENIEDEIFNGIIESKQKNKNIKMWLYRAVASAAILVILITAYLNVQTRKNTQLENEFFVLEQALSKVSKSITPDEQEEMLVLWVDEDVEIIIN